jgi:hypothetical protein
MKTALTELIEKWESEMGGYIPNAPIYKAFIEEAKTFLEKEKTELQDSTNPPLLIAPYVRQRIIDYTNWLMKQNLMICEGVDGYSFRSSMIGGKKYSAEDLYDKFVSEYVA